MKLLAPLARRSLEYQDFEDVIDNLAMWSANGVGYVQPFTQTMPGQKAETIANSFQGYVSGGYMGNGVVFGLTSVRLRVFSEARFQWQKFNNGRPGDLFGSAELGVLEKPWPGGTTGDLLAMMLLHVDFAGNAYVTRAAEQLVCLRPDWVEIVLGERKVTDVTGFTGTVGLERLGYRYYQGGKALGDEPMLFTAEQVAHFAPHPDPLASYRGMSWLTPVVREVQADGAATSHKLKFFENAATPNLAVSLKEITDPDQFQAFVEKMDEQHKGTRNAYKTLYTGGGADVSVIGADLQQLDFKVTQGAGETRLAQAAGVPPVVGGLSEGLQGSSLNAGNFGQARRQFADTTMAHLWRNVAGSLEVLVSNPNPATRLWVDRRDIPFLREDEKDAAEIALIRAQTIEQLLRAGYRPDSVIAAVENDDYGLLMGQHSGLFSIQLQEPGAGNTKLPGPSVDGGNANNPTPPGAVEKPATVAAPTNGSHP